MRFSFRPNITEVSGSTALPNIEIDMTGRAPANGVEAAKAVIETLYNMVPNSRLPFEIDLKRWTIDDLKAEMDRVLNLLPDEKRRRKVMHKVRREIERCEKAVKIKQAELRDAKERVQSAVDAVWKLAEWSQGAISLQKPHGSMMETFLSDLLEGRVFDFFQPASVENASLTNEEALQWYDMAEQASVYLVEHDWAAAFANAQDYAGGEIRMPDGVCAFEFRLMDRHVIAFATDADGVLYEQMAVQVRKGWVLFRAEDDCHGDANFSGIVAAVFAQIKAIAVALDSEVAVAEVVRQPHRSNRERQQHKLPLYSFHVIRLARRARAEPLESDGLADDLAKRRRRLHFRRGHWRHYETHKTWIKWMLVGDPSLGFIEKEYRL